MARSKPKKKKTKRKTKKLSGGGFRPLAAVGGLWHTLRELPWPHIGRWTSVAAWVVGAGAVLLAWTLGVPRLEAAVAAMLDCHAVFAKRIHRLLNNLHRSLRDLWMFVPFWLEAIEKRRALLLKRN